MSPKPYQLDIYDVFHRPGTVPAIGVYSKQVDGAGDA
jgi:hypothetical protein